MTDITEDALGRSRLDVAVAAPVTLARAAQVLGPARASWMGEPVPADVPVPAGMERHLIDLQMRMSERSSLVTFHKAAYLDVGAAEVTGDTVRAEVSWRAAGMAPLFPVFSGHLTWAHGSLSVSGFYAPPGGGMGVIADRLLLNVAARGTARWLLERIVTAMEAPSSDPASA